MYRIVFISGPHKGKRLAVQQDTVTIGRDPDCHIHLQDEGVSWRHAEIDETPDGVTIHDMGSLNRILVNNKEIRQAILKHGDEIDLGETKLRFQFIQPLVAENARRVSHVQGITFALVALIIILEIGFLIGLSLWRVDSGEWILQVEQKKAGSIEGAATAEPAAEAEVEEEKEQAREEEKEIEVAAAEPRKTAAQSRGLEPPPAEPEKEPEPTVEEPKGKEPPKEKPRKAPPPKPKPEPKPEPKKEELPPLPKEEEPEDPLLQLAMEMVEEARLEIKRHNMVQADHQFERVQIIAPEYFPAYAERARLYEARGMTKEAGEQWAELLKRSKGTKWYEFAMKERDRIAQQKMFRENIKPRQVESARKKFARLPRKVRIESIERQKFPKTDEFDGMRLITMVLRTHTSRKFIYGENVKVTVSFYDREAGTDHIVPTGAMVPEETLQFEGEWPRNERRTVSAACIEPKDFREEEKRRTGKKYRYYGYVVRVYHDGELHDIETRPQDLLELVVEEEISRD